MTGQELVQALVDGAVDHIACASLELGQSLNLASPEVRGAVSGVAMATIGHLLSTAERLDAMGELGILLARIDAGLTQERAS